MLTATIYGGGCPDRTVSTKQTPHKTHRIRPSNRRTYVAKVFDFRSVVSVCVHRSGIVIFVPSFRQKQGSSSVASLCIEQE